MIDPRILVIIIGIVFAELTAIYGLYPEWLVSVFGGIFSNALFWLLVIVLSILSSVVVFTLTFVMVPIDNKVKFFNRVTSKNLGVVEIARKGREINQIS